MIRITSFAEKHNQASRFFALNRSLRRFTPALRDGGSLLFLSTGAEAEAPAYYQSASPRRRRFCSPRVRVPSRVRLKSAKDTPSEIGPYRRPVNSAVSRCQKSVRLKQ